MPTSTAPYVVVIGAAAVDIMGAPNQRLAIHDANPGRIQIALGGVGRNIAENCALMGVRTELVAPIGDDVFGDLIYRNCQANHIHLSEALFLKESDSSTFMSINEVDGDLQLAIADMGIIDQLTPTYLSQKHEFLSHAAAIVLETNLTQETIEYVATHYAHVPLFCDAVSAIKSEKLCNILDKLHTLKPNQLEAAHLSGIEIVDERSLMRAVDFFLDKGIQQLFLTLGRRGAYYADVDTRGYMPAPQKRPKNTLGAGDAFVAATVEGFMSNRPIEETTRYAMLAAYMTLQHEYTVNATLSLRALEQLSAELNLTVRPDIPSLA